MKASRLVLHDRSGSNRAHKVTINLTGDLAAQTGQVFVGRVGLTVATILLTAAADNSSPLGCSTIVTPRYFSWNTMPSSRVSRVSVQFSGSSGERERERARKIKTIHSFAALPFSHCTFTSFKVWAAVSRM